MNLHGLHMNPPESADGFDPASCSLLLLLSAAPRLYLTTCCMLRLPAWAAAFCHAVAFERWQALEQQSAGTASFDRCPAAVTWLQGDALARARSDAQAAAKDGAAAQQARLQTQLGRLQAHCERLALELIEQQQVCAALKCTYGTVRRGI